jgi:hypothetical protein
MKHIVLVVACFGLTACASPKWQHRTASDIDFHRDSAACQASAGVAYPVAMTDLGRGYQAPTQINCSTFGKNTDCTSRPGAYTPPAQIDANVIARSRLYESCMLGNGYYRGANAPMRAEGNSVAVPVNRQTLTACRDYDRAARKGVWQEEQDEKRKIAALNLSEFDCKAMIANADR